MTAHRSSRFNLENMAGTLSRRMPPAMFVLTVFIVMVAGLVTYKDLGMKTDLAESRFSTESLLVSRYVSRLSLGRVSRGETKELQGDLADVLREVPQTRFAVVTDANGAVVAGAPNGYLPPPSQETSDFEEQGVPIRQFVTPFSSGGQAYHFRLGVNRAELLTEVKNIATASLIQTAVAVIVVLGLMFIGFVWILQRSRMIYAIAEDLKANDALIHTSAQDLRASAAEILAVARKTEEHSTDEAAAVDETRRTMRALLESANEIAEGARAVSEMADESSKATEQTANRIATLNAQAIRIGSVSDSIQSIADKSELLALNAALEGARAGESGRGFVLVAAEMRRLAESVMSAAHEIKKLSAEIREHSQSSVLSIEQSQKLLAKNTDTARRITLITSQQRTATEQVTVNMDEIQEYTHQALSGAKQAKATADDLARTSEALTRATSAAAGD